MLCIHQADDSVAPTKSGKCVFWNFENYNNLYVFKILYSEFMKTLSENFMQLVHIVLSVHVYRYSRGRWSSEGLKTVSVTSVGDIVTVTCASSHLTSFAVLVDVGGAQVC